MIGRGDKVDESNIKAIRSWAVPKIIHDIRSFHRRAFSYRWFIRNLSTIMASMTKVIKGSSFKWAPKADSTFEEVTTKLTKAPVQALPCFDRVLEVECDASGVGIGGVLTQEGQPLSFFSKKLCHSRRKYSTYD